MRFTNEPETHKTSTASLWSTRYSEAALSIIRKHNDNPIIARIIALILKIKIEELIALLNDPNDPKHSNINTLSAVEIAKLSIIHKEYLTQPLHLALMLAANTELPATSDGMPTRMEVISVLASNFDKLVENAEKFGLCSPDPQDPQNPHTILEQTLQFAKVKMDLAEGKKDWNLSNELETAIVVFISGLPESYKDAAINKWNDISPMHPIPTSGISGPSA